MDSLAFAPRASGFRTFELDDGVLIRRALPRRYDVLAWRRHELQLAGGDFAQFGYVASGKVEVTDAHGVYVLTGGMYFSTSGALTLRPIGNSPGILLRQEQATVPRLFGGPLEATGRLRYIDACTDSLLLSPARRGDACLNHLHIPPGIRQTAHFHTSDRVGVIARGRGRAVLPQTQQVFELAPESGWLIEAGLVHHFTTQQRDSLDVIAWHPDSEIGPSDDDHPMLNRTFVGIGKAVRGVRG